MFLLSVTLSLAFFVSLRLVEIHGIEFRYHTNEEMGSVLKNLTEQSGNVRTNMYSIGKTYLGNQLWILSLTAAEEEKIGVPNVKLIGNTHGNEAVGREILLQFIEYLLSYYGSDETITRLLDTTRIHVMPSLNPDGFQNSQINCDGSTGREAGRRGYKIDLNRNFPDYFHDNSKIIRQTEESTSMMKLMENNTFILSAALHGGALVANYPFDSVRETLSTGETYPSPTPDDDVFRHLARTYASNHPSMYLGKKCPGSEISFEGGITNGAKWYEVEGGMGDYNYAFHGCMEVTMEISCCKYPAAKELPKLWEENKKSLLQYCIQAHRGVTGQIVDFDTGKPIQDASLKVIGRNMTFWSSKNTGEFWRILLPGSYKLQVQAEGYYTKIVPFTVPDYNSSFPKLVVLGISLYNISLYTTTEATTSSTVQTEKTLPTETIRVVDRFSDIEDVKVSPPVVQMSISCGSLNYTIKKLCILSLFISMKHFLC